MLVVIITIPNRILLFEALTRHLLTLCVVNGVPPHKETGRFVAIEDYESFPVGKTISLFALLFKPLTGYATCFLFRIRVS